MKEMPCSTANLPLYNKTHDLSDEVYQVVSVANILILTTAILGNSVILAAVAKCETLHPPSKALLFSLLLSDLGVGVVVVQLALNLAMIFKTQSPYCLLWRPFLIIVAVMGSVSFLTSTAIAVDRYLAFRLRLRYRQTVTLRRVVFVVIMEWILALIWTCLEIVNENLSWILGTAVILSCVFCTLICYQGIYKGLRHKKARVQVQCQSAPSQNNRFIDVGQYERSVASILWVYCFLLILHVPYYLNLVLLIAFDSYPLVLAKNVTSVLIYLNSSLNPVIYCWRMKEIRQETLVIYRKITSICR